MSDITLEEKPSEITRGGTVGSLNVLQVRVPYVWVTLVNAQTRGVAATRWVVSNRNDVNESYQGQTASTGSIRQDVLQEDGTYDVDFPDFLQADWYRFIPSSPARTARISTLTAFKLKFRALLIDELGVPIANTQVTVTYDDTTTETPSTDGQGFLIVTVAMGKHIASVTIDDFHESAFGEGVQTASGTHHRTF